MIRLATEQEIETWDSLVQSNPDGGHIYQSKAWCEFKKSHDWDPQYLIYEEPGVIVAFVLLKKQISMLGNLYYCSKGPGVFRGFKADHDSKAHFTELCGQLQTYLTRTDRKAILCKLEPELEDGQMEMEKLNLVTAKADLQFKATIFVDLSPSEEEILASFKQKTRYNIRLAERKEVVVSKREMDDEGVELMYELMAATQNRAGFFLRKKDYFASYWKALYQAGMAEFLVATYKHETLAGVYVTKFGSKSYYKDGGSFSIHRNLMAPYLLQWEAMRWAKQNGAISYDLVAVPPKNQLDNPEHHQYGLYQFKRGFNEEVTEFVGCYDLPINRSKYRIWLKNEKYYLRLYSKLKKNLFW